MRVAISAGLEVLGNYLPRFVALVGLPSWRKRAEQLIRQAKGTPYMSKVVQDYHWLELELAHLWRRRRLLGRIPAQIEAAQTRPALHFAALAVQIHQHLSPGGRRVLEGRLRDALRAGTGFAALHVEIEVAAILMAQGFDVGFPDMEGKGNFDLLFRKGSTEGEVECKSLSTDAGRKIHQKDFYRFIASLGAQIESRTSIPGTRDLLVVTVTDRFPANTAQQEALCAAARQILAEKEQAKTMGPFFCVERVSFDQHLSFKLPINEREIYKQCQVAFGQNCHVSGVVNESARCLVIVRSLREDDHSKPVLEALQKAATQFPGSRPAFICVQFDDIVATDLTLPHLRERFGLLSNHLFHSRRVDHVAATCFSAYRTAFSPTPYDIRNVGIAYWNPKCTTARDPQLPFRDHIPDDAFAELCVKSEPGRTPIDMSKVASSKSWKRRRRRQG